MPPSSMQWPMQTPEIQALPSFAFIPRPSPSLTFCHYYGHGLDHLSFGWWLLTFSWSWSIWAHFLKIVARLNLVYNRDITMFRSCWKSSIASCPLRKNRGETCLYRNPTGCQRCCRTFRVAAHVVLTYWGDNIDLAFLLFLNRGRWWKLEAFGLSPKGMGVRDSPLHTSLQLREHL